MKYILLFTLVSLGFSMPKGLAQSDFKKGFIVTPEKDTVHGEIDSGNEKIIRFRRENTIKEFTPSQLPGYGFNDGKYFTSRVLENSFVEALIVGELNLYKHDQGYFIQKSGGEIHKLESPKVAVQDAGIRKSKEDTRWKGIVAYLTTDCEQSEQLLQKLSLNELSLVNFVISYHKCREAAYTDFKAGKSLFRMGVGLTAGLAQSFIKVEKEMNQFGHLKDLYSSVDPFCGLVFEASFPRLGERVALQTEFLLIKSNYWSYLIMDLPHSRDYHTATIDVTSLSVPVLLKYSLTGNRIPLFLQLGISYDNHFKFKSVLISEREYPDNTRSVIEGRELVLRNRQIGFIGGVGVGKSFNKFKGVLALRYLHGHQPYDSQESNQTGLSHIPDLLAKIDRLSLSLILLTK